MHPKLEFIERILALIIALALVGTGFIMMLKKSVEPVVIIIKCAFTVPFVFFCIWSGGKMGLGGPFMIVFMAVVLTYVWISHISEFVSNPLTSLFDGGNVPIEKKPFYSIAHARRKKGAYHEAVAEIQKQLKRFPNDFEGTMLLASIQAENLNDLRGAENIIENGCHKARWPDVQIAAALTQVADWHLKLGVDVESARVSLQKIIDRFPVTEISLKAEQRMAHLVETEKILLARHDRPKIVLQEGIHNLGLRDTMQVAKPPEIEPGRLAEVYVKHLAEHPHDSEVREKLAVIYARDFKRLDLATMELAVLINETRHSAKQIAGWLNTLANFQVELGADIDTVRDTLQKIVERFPDLPLAQVTQRRLARLENEFKVKKETPGVKLGVYEQNIGLKYGSPRKL